jgi:DNA polymerase III gamma/tau subunit
MELYLKYRPDTLDSIVGQPAAVKQLKGFVTNNSVPHVLGFFGPAGTGKTTLARIMASHVGATGMNVNEINAAVRNGVDDMRALQERTSLRPLGGGNAVYILDESHSLSKQAFQSLLKLLEDTPPHAYFMLCTSQPEKIDKAIRTRITGITLNPIPTSAISQQLAAIASAEGVKVDVNSIDSIAKSANGSLRMAIVYLEQFIAAGCDPVILPSIFDQAEETNAWFPLCSEIIWPKKSWESVYALLSKISEDEVEKVRLTILSYAKSVMKDSKHADRAAYVITAMQSPFFDSKLPGFFAKYRIVWAKR